MRGPETVYRSFNARAVGLSVPAEHAIRLASAGGFRGVDLLVRDIVESGGDPAAIRSMLEDAGLRGGAWPLPVSWRGEDETFRSHLRSLPKYAAAAQVLGLTRTGTWVLPGVGPDMGTDAEVFDWHHGRLAAIARILDDHGSRLGLEVIGVESFRSGMGRPYLHRLANLGPLVEALRAEVRSVGVLVDAFHLHAAGEGVEQALAWGGGGIVWVHVADVPAIGPVERGLLRDEDRGLPGENGVIDVGGLLRALAGAGYDGPVTVETLAGCRSLRDLAPEIAVHRVSEALDRVWPMSEGSS